VAGDHPFQHGSQPRATGHLWQQRYQRVLVEPDSQALSAMACYIEMNPVRASLVKDPNDDRWCGYGQALANVSQAQAGIVHLYKADGKMVEGSGPNGAVEWNDVAERYRMLIFETGVRKNDGFGNTTREGFSSAEIRDVLSKGGALSFGQLMHCRVAYFSTSVAFGSREFVEGLEPLFRETFGLKHKREASSLAQPKSAFHVFRRPSGQIRPSG